MVAGQTGGYDAGYGFAIMQSDNDGKYYLAHIGCDYGGQYSDYPIASFVEIPSSSTLLKNERMAAPATGDFVYYSIGNKLYTYTNASGVTNRDKLQITLPEGETISYMFNFRDTYNLTYNYLAVLSNTADGWKLRLYEPEGIDVTEIKQKPVAEYSGTGTARYVMYRDN